VRIGSVMDLLLLDKIAVKLSDFARHY